VGARLAAERVLTAAELNRATLARQLLLRRTRLPVARAIERVGGLQAQKVTAPYLGLLARLDGFSPAALTHALERRRVVKATLMRGTLHLVSADDYLALSAALHPTLEVLWRRYAPDAGRTDYADIARATLEYVEEPRTGPELRDFVAGLSGAEPTAAENVWWRLRINAPLLRVPPDGVWGGGPRVWFVTARAWLGQEPRTDRDAATEALVVRYLTAFGPAGLGDFCRWSGMARAPARAAFRRLDPELRRCRDETGRELLDVRRAPLPPADTPAPARLLAMWDSMLLAYEDRTRVLPEEYRKLVIDKRGDVAQTILVDGRACGVWHVVDGRRVRLEPFEPLPRTARREVEAEALRVEAFLARTPE
jgi:winged helix DNA-binding protein